MDLSTFTASIGIQTVSSGQVLLFSGPFFYLAVPVWFSKSVFRRVSSPLRFLSPSLRLTDMHQPFAAHYVNSPTRGCQLLMSPLGLFKLEISAGRVEGWEGMSLQPHEEGQSRSGLGQDRRTGVSKTRTDQETTLL